MFGKSILNSWTVEEFLAYCYKTELCDLVSDAEIYVVDNGLIVRNKFNKHTHRVI